MNELSDSVVSRYVRAPRHSIEEALAALGFRRSATGGAWIASERLPRAGDRVDIEVWLWGDEAAELTVRPASRRPLAITRSKRHERRYFDDAHRTASELADQLTPPVHSKGNRAIAA